jgi:hypothetical protein
VCDADEIILIKVGMLGKNNYCWRHWSPINVEPWWGSNNELVLSLCVKALARWIVEGLCSSEGIPEPGRVSATRKRQLRSAYGMVVVIMRVCQMEQ